MCNPMHMPRNELVLSIIMDNEGEKKHLDDWATIIHDQLPKPRRMTKRSITHILSIVAKNNGIIAKREVVGRNIFFEFSKQNEDIKV